MENKGLVKLFAILFGLVSIYQLSFTFRTQAVERQAKSLAELNILEAEDNYVEKRKINEVKYLDSIGNTEVFNIGIAKFTYSEIKEKELNKGLDLKGGINVILQISIKDILKGLSNNSKEISFNKALALADENSKESSDTYLELFFEAFESIEGANKLSAPTIFSNKTLSDVINFQMTNEDVKPVLRKKIDESIVSAFEVLRKRIDKFGVVQPNIQRLGTSGRILVELPGAKDIERVKKLLQSTAQLEFWHTYKNSEFSAYFSQVNTHLKTIEDLYKYDKENVKETITSEIDTLLSTIEQDSLEQNQSNEPLFKLFASQSYSGSPVLGSFAIKDTATVNAYLKIPEIVQLLPNHIKQVKFLWGKPKENTKWVDLYAVKYNRTAEPPLSGSVINDATQTYDLSNQAAVSMQMNGKGARVWEKMTNQAFKQQTCIAIILDNIVYSAPGVSSGPISGGRSEITGNFTLNEAKDLANVLRAGKLPASASIIQSEFVGPSLGKESIENGINSFLIAMVIVLFWMILYYGFAGGLADIALVFNIVLIFGVLSGLGAVLTLPGIAGIVLTIGMSVDANVIIFERIKEELRKGKGQKQAVGDGFGNALSSILDANITTGLTAIILLIFGTGPIQGFATTLLIGIATSLFTAIFVTRLLIDGFSNKKRQFTFNTLITKNFFKNVNIEFLKKRKITYIFSLIIIVLGLSSLFTKGLNQGVDFVGGRSYQVRFDKAVNPSLIANALSEKLGSAEAKTFGGDNQLKITTKYKVNEESESVDDEIQKILFNTLKTYRSEELTYESFISGSGDKNVGIMSSIKVGPTIADDIKENSLWAVLGSLVVVFLYILLRFRRWQFSVGAVSAVFHDVLLVIGIFSLTYDFMPFSMEIDQAFIAAILTVIGYSLNDTVIVFDRIRELVPGIGWRSGKHINTALNATLGRTLNTSLTTLIVLLSIFIFGGESMRGFMFALIVGVVVGTYSSIFIATPIMFDTLSKEARENK